MIDSYRKHNATYIKVGQLYLYILDVLAQCPWRSCNMYIFMNQIRQYLIKSGGLGQISHFWDKSVMSQIR